MIQIKQNIKEFLYYFKRINRFFYSPTSKKTIVILGMHRSGTSLTAGILNLFGINMGSISIDTDKYNKKGHYENTRISNLNKKILKELGGSWDRPPEPEIVKANHNRFDKDIRSVLKFEKRKLWALKDPRMALLIDYYLPFLDNPIYIVCRRSHRNVAKSLNRRNNILIKEGEKLSIEYNKRIDEFIKDKKYLEINFPDYFIKPKDVVNTLAAYININIEDKIEESVIKFISPDLVTSGQE